MASVETEHVLVVPTEVFHNIGHFQGFTTEVAKYLDELLSPEHTSYRARSVMEEDPSFKQLIPYVIFRYTSPDGAVSVFQYTRGKGQGESRLHHKRSIGIGGHISSDDATSDSDLDPYREGMQRELSEEVIIQTAYRDQLVGMLNDDETEVGKVHLGIVHIFDVESPQLAPREDEIVDSSFEPVEQLLADLDGFETWSSICLKALFSQQ